MAKKTMKAQVFYKPNQMRLEEVPIPRIGDDEILVRVKACGICGSDIAYYFGLSPLETRTGEGPLILGHEYTGQVVEVGKIPAQRKLFKPGDRVVLDPLMYCYACEVCGRGQVNLCENKSVLGVSVNGGFAEYSKCKYTSAHVLPANVSYEHGALTEPLACSFYGVKNLQVEPGMTCVVLGPGPVGLMMVQLMKSSGAGKLIVVGARGDDYRLNLALQLGKEVEQSLQAMKGVLLVRHIAADSAQEEAALLLMGGQLMSIGFLAELFIAYHDPDIKAFSISERTDPAESDLGGPSPSGDNLTAKK